MILDAETPFYTLNHRLFACSYFVTWKADGTRYLMLLLKYGAYIIDRAGEVSDDAYELN